MARIPNQTTDDLNNGDSSSGKLKLDTSKIRSLEEVSNLVNQHVGADIECWFLIGAGASYPEVPLAPEFVSTIKQEYAAFYGQAKEPKGYAECMQTLPPRFRQALIKKNMQESKVTEGYLALACLLDGGYVDQILTTNFDSLILRACALVGKLPAVYDLAASLYNVDEENRIRPAIAKPSLLHLHGQNEGIVLVNDPEQATGMSNRLDWLFEGAEKKLWIVIGYSGENDPVFQKLANVREFEAGLYWIRHDHELPCDAVCEMIAEKSGAYVVFDHSANDALRTLAQKAGVYPPELLSDPFTGLENRLIKDLNDHCQGTLTQTFETVRNAKTQQQWQVTQALELQRRILNGDLLGALDEFETTKQFFDESTQKNLIALLAQSSEQSKSLNELERIAILADGVGLTKETAESLILAGQEHIRIDPDMSLTFMVDRVDASGVVPCINKVSLFGVTSISEIGLKCLQKFPCISELTFSGTSLSDADLKNLEKVTALKELRLSSTQVGNIGMKSLAKLTGLTKLYLSHTQVSDAGLKSIAKLTNLVELRLSNTDVSDIGLKSLYKLVNLVELRLSNTQITKQGMDDLQAKLPNCTINANVATSVNVLSDS